MRSEELENLANANNLISSFYETRSGTDWKESVQRYEINLLQNIRKSQKQILDGSYELKPCVEFQLCERGHKRNIKSMHISDRVVLHSFCKNVLTPKVRPKLIYDNGASLKDKGIGFSRKRFCIHLNKYYQQHGNKGYIRLFDFSKFFDNIQHDTALEEYRPLINKSEFEFLQKMFQSFEIDVSYLTDTQYASCMDTVFNSLEHAKIDKSLLTGKKMMRKSLGIGNQISQVTGVFYPYMVDNFVKIVCGIKYYGRYMDDFYILSPSVAELDRVTEGIYKICADFGLFLNRNKIRTYPLDREFVFLKTIYRLCGNGRIIKRIPKDNISRERRKIRKFRRMADNKSMTVRHALDSYKSWRGTYKKYDSKYEIVKLDRLFLFMFSEVSKI